MAYLITCAGSKKRPTAINKSQIENLSYNNSLLEARTSLIELLKIQLDWSKTLPAWQLYTGNRSKIYNKIDNHNWIKESTDIKILSALFGWVKHTDLLPYYDLKMDSKIPILNIPVHKYWHEKNILAGLVDKNLDIDLLSINYRKALHGKGTAVAKVPEITFNDYGESKGIWLNERLK